MNKLVTALAFAAASIACGGDAGTSAEHSCTMIATTASLDLEQCFEYDTGESTARDVCDESSLPALVTATFDAASGCETTGNVGSCYVPGDQGGGITFSYTVYFFPEYTTALGQATCAGVGGEFTPGP